MLVTRQLFERRKPSGNAPDSLRHPYPLFEPGAFQLGLGLFRPFS